MTERKLITISDAQWAFVKGRHLNISAFVQDSIDHARCIYDVTIRPDQQKWIEAHHINLNLIIQAAIDKEMNGNGW